MNKTSDFTLLIGRLALIALYTSSAIGKFGALDQTAAMIGSKGLPFATALTLVAAAAELTGALCIAVGYHTRAAAIGLVLYRSSSRSRSTASGDWKARRVLRSTSIS